MESSIFLTASVTASVVLTAIAALWASAGATAGAEDHGLSPRPTMAPADVRPVVLVIAYAKTALLRKTLSSISEADAYRMAAFDESRTSQWGPQLPVYVSVDNNRRAQR